MRGTRTRRGLCAAALVAGVLTACGGETSKPATGTDAHATSPQPDAPADLEQRYAQAWQLAEMDGRPADAARLFRGIAEHPQAPDALRARSLLGLARAARAAGDRDAADAALRTIEESYAALPGVTEAARAERRALEGSIARWSRVDVALYPGQFLDLDTATIAGAAVLDDGSRTELTLRDGSALFLVDKSADDAFSALVADGDARPWWRVETDSGARAWVRVAAAGGALRADALVLRDGDGRPRAGARRPACVGGAGSIDVWFEAADGASRYRVERRDTPDAPYVLIGEVAAAPYHDAHVADGVRYGYRIVALAANGDEALPAVVQGTTASRGVVSGVCVLANEPGRTSFDFLTGVHVGAGGDLTLTGTYGGQTAASFLDGAGRPVVIADATGPGAGMNAGWRAAASPQIPVGTTFDIALRGGGVARLRLRMPDDAWHVTLVYDVDPDAPPFATSPALTFDERADGTLVRTTAPAGYAVRELLVRDPFADDAPASLQVKDGTALDGEGVEGTLREYEAVAVDAHGRRSPRSVARCNRLPDVVQRGGFELGVAEGWSLERGAAAPGSSADLVLERSNGGGTSLWFAAPGGITSLALAVGTDRSSPAAERLAPAVLGVATDSTDSAPWRDTIVADRREPESDVLVLRTRNGGYARVVVVKHASGRAAVEYAYNPRAPRFEEADERAQVVRGLVLAPAAVPASPARDAARRGAHVVRPESADDALRGTAGGSMPADDACQEVLLARTRYGDVEKSTYHFGLAARDDPGLALRGDTFDVAYLGDALDVNVGAGVLSLVSDVGAFTWQEVAEQQPQSAFGNMPAVASHGHVYALHAPHSRAFAEVLLRVTALDPGVRCAFEWIAWDANGVVHTSQGLVLDDATRAGLARLVASHAELLPGARAQPKTSRSAASADAQIRETSVSLNANDAALADVLREICKQAGVTLRFSDGAAEALEGKRTSCDVLIADAGMVLDMLAQTGGVTWTVGEDGAVVVSKK